ncbi:hypothetical protein D3C86_1559630 [compost metagenome]
MGLLEILQRVAVVDRLGGHGAFLRRVIDRLGCGGRTLGLVDRDLVGIRIAFEQGQLTCAQLVLVLLGIGRGNGEQGLVGGIRVAEKVIFGRGCARLQAAGPGRDAAIGITGFLGAQWRQGTAQLGRLLFGNGRHYAGSHQGKGQGQSAGFEKIAWFHCYFPLSDLCQKFTPKLRAT